MASFGVIPCKQKPPMLQSPFKQDSGFELPAKPSTLSLPKPRPVPPTRITETHLSLLCKSGSFTETVAALDEISSKGLKIKPDTFTELLDYCIDFNFIELGRELHARINLVDEVETFVGTKLVSMYAKCGLLADARKAFDEMSKRDLYTWSAIMGAYSRERRWKEVIELFEMMMEDGTLPDEMLYPKLLRACANCGYYEIGRMVHSLAIRSGMGSLPRVCNALLALYVKCGKFGSARRFFGKMKLRDTVSWNSIISGYCQSGEKHEAFRLLDVMCKEGIEPGLVTWNILIASYMKSHDCDAAMELMRKMESFGVAPDVFTWTSLISGFAQNNRLPQALELLKEMISSGTEPNDVTIASAVSACASLKSLENGKQVHCTAVKKGLSNNLLVGNSLVEMYAKCGDLEAARQVFDMMVEKDFYTWNSMIGGYCLGGYCGKAHGLFMKMQESEVKPNVVTWNVMILGYMNNGDEDRAINLFQKMMNEGIVKPNTSSWNTVISGYLHNGYKNKALGVFRHMLCMSVRPNLVTLLTILPACANLIAANKVREIHAFVLRRSLQSNTSVSNCLIDAYAKSSNIVYSRSLFNTLTIKDIITWNSLISGYVLHACADDALHAYDEMRRTGFKPNRGTFVSLILAYSLNKMIDNGKRIFLEMTEKYQIIPGSEHYTAMVDLLGRSGLLVEANKFIVSMETEPDSDVWDALLTASRFHGNIEVAFHAGKSFLKLVPGNIYVYQLISQMNSIRGRSFGYLEKLNSSKRISARKIQGCTLVEIKNEVYSFVTGDRHAPSFDSVHSWLDSIAEKIKPPVSKGKSFVEEEEEEEICGVHSEKLALGFAFVGNPPTAQPLRLVKNFRMCNDCHNTAKFLSLSCGCEIFLHDTKCLHHFKDGQCSCGDYW